MSIQKTGATTPSENSLPGSRWLRGQRPPRRAPRYRDPRCAIPLRAHLGTRFLERVGNIRDVLVQASLRYQRAGQDHTDHSERQQQKAAFDDECRHGDDSDDQQEVMIPSARRCTGSAVSRLQYRSNAPIRRPIQLTG